MPFARHVARSKNCSAAQLALAFLLTRGNVVPIPGPRRIERLEENAAAEAITLSDEDLAAIDRVTPPGAASGTRYDEARMRMVNL